MNERSVESLAFCWTFFPSSDFIIINHRLSLIPSLHSIVIVGPLRANLSLARPSLSSHNISFVLDWKPTPLHSPLQTPTHVRHPTADLQAPFYAQRPVPPRYVGLVVKNYIPTRNRSLTDRWPRLVLWPIVCRGPARSSDHLRGLTIGCSH